MLRLVVEVVGVNCGGVAHNEFAAIPVRSLNVTDTRPALTSARIAVLHVCLIACIGPVEASFVPAGSHSLHVGSSHRQSPRSEDDAWDGKQRRYRYPYIPQRVAGRLRIHVGGGR